MLKNFYHFFIILLISTSCANIKPIQKPRPQYDADVEKSFEDIEREKILNYYFELRKKQANKPDYRPTRRRQKRKTVKIYKPAKPQKKRSPKIVSDPKENAIRMEQMLSYYCIKNSNRSNCKQFTETIALNCKDDYDMDDQRIVQCVQKKLGSF